MISFPNAKINLGLNILRKRDDGYHDLETVFYPVAVKDALEFITAKELHFQTTGLAVEGSHKNNLCVKAYLLLKTYFPDLPPIHIHLHKAIPMGAGLGGGSADAAFMLVMLNKKYELQLSTEKLLEYALQPGSDCPFFIINKPCFATGRGEELDQVDVDLSAHKIVIVNPGIHVSTKEAFAALTPSVPHKSIRQIIQQPIETWKDELVNDFERTVFATHPIVGNLKQQLYDAGARYASMSGSGSTVFGIFAGDAEINLTFPPHYYCKILL